jgi:hypothetical protein
MQPRLPKRQQSLFVSGKPGLPKGVWVFHRAKQVLWDAKKACGHVWMSATLNCAAPIIQGPTVIVSTLAREYPRNADFLGSIVALVPATYRESGSIKHENVARSDPV